MKAVLPETLSNVTGKRIRRIKPNSGIPGTGSMSSRALVDLS